MSDHYVPKGYEEVAFFGRDSHSLPGEGTPEEAAVRCAALFENAYIDECRDGWTVCAQIEKP